MVSIGIARSDDQTLILQREQNGHILARMAFEIEFVDDALESFKELSTPIKTTIKEAMETHLRHEPKKKVRVGLSVSESQ